MMACAASYLLTAQALTTELLSSHSELDPPLPIPNRAVKRLSADDSADYPCESRTLLGSLSRQAPDSVESGAFAFHGPVKALFGKLVAVG